MPAGFFIIQDVFLHGREHCSGAASTVLQAKLVQPRPVILLANHITDVSPIILLICDLTYC